MAVPLPSGTVTFLFTDVEGSTQRWEAHHAAMDAALKRHNALMRSAMEQHDGCVFKTVGDAFCVAFARVSDGIAAAIAAQEALEKEDFSAVGGLKVRMGLHAGEAFEHDGDYFGPAVNRAARLMSVGHGGQTLVSEATRALIRSDLPKGVVLTALGPHRLKDLLEAESVWQLSTDQASNAFPPLTSLSAYPNNLPMQVTGFYGRDEELQELKAHLRAHRLVTVFGAGGIGKSRIAVQAAADLLDHFPDGVWIADLAPIADPDSVSSVVAKAIEMRQSEAQRVDELIPRWLKDKRSLLVLDNCEHVLERVAHLADAVHRSCAEVRILATSRQALAVSGEKLWRLRSLAVPAIQTKLVSAAAIQFGAIALFVDRASLVDQTFRLTEENASVVADICRRLDGIPLAIELAAARLKVLSVRKLEQKLDERFKILTGGSRTALPRQQTLRALIDWSYDLLSREEQILFSRVAIFAGSFALEAATSVCADDDIEELDVFDLVGSLADKSLVVPDTGGDQERYHLLESTREYALERLSANGERDRLARRHASHYLALGREAANSFNTMPLNRWLAGVEVELENYRAVLEWALRKGEDPALGGAVAAALECYWWHGGVEAEGRRWISLALDRIEKGEHPEETAALTHALGLLTSRLLFS